MKTTICIILTALLAAVIVPAGTHAGTVVKDGTLKADAVWSGEVLVEKVLRVPDGVRLTVMPGTVVSFRKGAGLMVEGELKAVGTEKSAIKLVPDRTPADKGYWQGVSLDDSGDGTELSHVRIESASAALMLSVCSPRISVCDIRDGIQGILLVRKASPLIERCVVTGMSEAGISVQMGSAPRIAGCTIEDTGKAGIASSQDSFPDILGNTVRGCETGISINRYAVAVEGNLIEKNGCGISALFTQPEVLIANNRIVGNGQAGIICQQFSNPQVKGNLVKGNKQGILCYRASSPLITNNEITGNEEGIICVQICNPKITRNDIHDNMAGIVLELSSYASINGNNFGANEAHLRLGESMSSDWESRAGNKPIRGGDAQYMNMNVPDGGKMPGVPTNFETANAKSVDATGNWWGKETTAEMEREGADADIMGIIDYFDVQVRKYEGYEGEYVQDRVVYKGWLKKPVSDAGRRK